MNSIFTEDDIVLFGIIAALSIVAAVFTPFIFQAYMNQKIILGISLFIVAQILSWFATNSQLVWKWWEDKPIFSACVFAIPIGLAFWYGTRFIYGATEQLWTARFLGFGASYLTFPILTYFLLNESMFTAKTIICTMLAIIIMCIQLFWE